MIPDLDIDHDGMVVGFNAILETLADLRDALRHTHPTAEEWHIMAEAVLLCADALRDAAEEVEDYASRISDFSLYGDPGDTTPHPDLFVSDRHREEFLDTISEVV